MWHPLENDLNASIIILPQSHSFSLFSLFFCFLDCYDRFALFADLQLTMKPIITACAFLLTMVTCPVDVYAAPMGAKLSKPSEPSEPSEPSQKFEQSDAEKNQEHLNALSRGNPGKPQDANSMPHVSPWLLRWHPLFNSL
jgi:hypothetical protein